MSRYKSFLGVPIDHTARSSEWLRRSCPRWSVRDLARLAQISPTTVTRAEADLPVNKTVIAAIERALEAAGIEFIPENGGGPGVRLKAKRQ